jgi:hypothetical protein
MATFIEELSRDLAYKLQDPVDNGTDDGQRYPAEARAKYLIRAYNRLFRYISVNFPSLMREVFPFFFEVREGNETRTGPDGVYTQVVRRIPYTVMVNPVEDPPKERWKEARYLPLPSYNVALSERNKFAAPSTNKEIYIYTISNGAIKIAPKGEYALSITIRKSAPEEQTDLSEEYKDIILSIAAMEAYMDLGQEAYIQTYRQDAMDQLQLLAGGQRAQEDR